MTTNFFDMQKVLKVLRPEDFGWTWVQVAPYRDIDAWEVDAYLAHRFRIDGRIVASSKSASHVVDHIIDRLKRARSDAFEPGSVWTP